MEIRSALTPHLPPAALAYCADLWQRHPFELRIVRPRRTRLGDFTRKPGTTPRITLNADLNPYAFLITYLHEVAHHLAYSAKPLRKKMAPHGLEWQVAFRDLLTPVLTESYFPTNILLPLRRYAACPKASTGSDAELVLALARYNALPAEDNKKSLRYLSEGVSFVFQEREFTRGPIRRTRVLCVEKASNRRYTIPAHALVRELKVDN